MQYSLLGNTGLTVSRLAFGAVTFTAGNKDLGAVYKVGADLAGELVGRALGAGIKKANGLAPFTHGQMYYSLVGRDVERDVIPMMRRYGLGLTHNIAMDRPVAEALCK